MTGRRFEGGAARPRPTGRAETAEFYDENDITVLLGSVRRRWYRRPDGDARQRRRDLHDELVITAAWCPSGPSLPDLEGIRVLRTFEESLALREHAGSAKRAVVIGAGFIGCEVAASLRKLGVDVTIVEPQPSPLASVLGQQIGDLVARLHRAEGVAVRVRRRGHRRHRRRPRREGDAVGRHGAGR
jgi:NADPH-dependent 2,4-dienoyl-CoA reductase/sulfur reductase-like enzyme